VTDSPIRAWNTRRRVAGLLLLGLVVLFGGVYVAGYLLTGDKVPRGTTVAGVDIGGLHPVSAETKLREELRPRAKKPLVVSAEGRRARIKPKRAGLAVDYEKSVEQAGAGRTWSPAGMWDYFTGGDDLTAVLDVDDKALAAAVDRFARKVDRRPVEGTVLFRNGQADPRLPQSGRKVDRERATEAVTTAFLSTEGTQGSGSGDAAAKVVPLPVEEVQPEVSDEAVRKAMDDFAKPAMSAPVTFVLEGENVVVRPAAYAPALSMKAKNGDLVAKLDRNRLMRAVRAAVSQVAPAPRDATVKLAGGRPTVVHGRNGLTIDRKEVVGQFLSLVVKHGHERTLQVKGVVDRPDFTTAEARKLRINEVVSTFTTEFPHSDYRNTNLGRAAELVTGTVLKPGETFSLNGTVGERTAENGFTKGYIIDDGVYKEDFGGGVSQVATTLFNAAFFAGLEDVEHKPHSFYIDRYPIGREATVAWGAVDLRFKNDTPYGILIESWINPSTPSSSGQMNVRMWSTKYWDITAGVSDRYDRTKEKTRYLQGKNCVPNDGYGGFDIDVFRYFRRVGSEELVRKETMHTTYTPSDTVICRKKPEEKG
jgi:vancomycin resistance protein YoaR